MSIEQLDQLQVRYHRATKWVGTGQDRKQVELDEVTSVQLPLTPDDWCSLAQYEGDNYMGPCCGNMGAMQDVLNSVFRESGWARAADFRFIAESCIDHDGFDEFEDPAPLASACTEGLDTLEPWAKIGVTWQAVQDILAVEAKELPDAEDLSSFDAAIQIAGKHIGLVRWSNIWAAQREDGGQSRCVKMTDLAALLASLRTIYDDLKQRKLECIDAVALRGQDGAVGANYRGAAIFTDQAEAERVLTLWKENEKFDQDRWSIVPCRVTVDKGLEWLE